MTANLQDNVAFMRKEAITVLIQLLASKPENEEFILSQIINKFGDSDAKVITHLNKQLGFLILKHSNMIPVLIREIK